MVTIHFFVKAALVVIFDSLTPNTVQIKLNEINYFCSEKMLKDIGSTRWILQESFLGCSYVGEYVWNCLLVYSPTKKFSPTYFTKTDWFLSYFLLKNIPTTSLQLISLLQATNENYLKTFERISGTRNITK